MNQSIAEYSDKELKFSALSFKSELDAISTNETWFKLGEWSHGYEVNQMQVQQTVMRQSLLIPKNAFPKVFKDLESIGNVLQSMGKSGGSTYSSGSIMKYRYEAFHNFQLNTNVANCEPIVFFREVAKNRCLFLNPDIVIQLGLIEKVIGSGLWWDPEASVEVIRLVTSPDNIESIQIHTSYLNRYLRNRQMALLTGHYCHRHLYNPTEESIEAFEVGDVILGSAKEHSKALLQNWGLNRSSGEPFLQRRLHLWFEILPPPLNTDDPWAEEPPFDPYSFTIPTTVGPVCPARWKHFQGKNDKKRFKGETCEFMKSIFFRQEVLVRYETSSDFNVTDTGNVYCGSYWGLYRSTVRLGNDLLGTAIGDWAEGVPFAEWLHWQMHAVSPPSDETISALRATKPIPDLINDLALELGRLNWAFMSLAGNIGLFNPSNLWNGSLDSLAARQLKWVYPANANEDEFLKRATLASTFVSDGLLPKPMRDFFSVIHRDLHLNKDKKPLGSRNLLQRLVLVATIIKELNPPLNQVPELIDQIENPAKKLFDDQLRFELTSINARVRNDFAPLAFVYDLRVHGGIAHPPNKEAVAEAAEKLGLRSIAWNREDFIRLIQLLSTCIEQITLCLSQTSRLSPYHSVSSEFAI